MFGFGTASRVDDGVAAAVCETEGPGDGLAPRVAGGDGVRTSSTPPEQEEMTKAIATTRRFARRSPDRA
jgi:hypothetical protein